MAESAASTAIGTIRSWLSESLRQPVEEVLRLALGHGDRGGDVFLQGLGRSAAAATELLGPCFDGARW